MRILSVNVGKSRDVNIKERTVQTSIYKMPVGARVQVHRLGLEGDARIEPRKMGPEHHAVYAYPFEHYAHWQEVLGREPFPMGQFGENLTVSGLLEDEVRIGDIFRFGNTVLQVAHPRIPCAKLNERMGLRFAPMFLASCKVGFYFRVLEEGDVGENDAIELLERDPASPTMEEFVRITQYEYWDAQGLKDLLKARDLMPAWREIIEGKLARTLAVEGWQGMREFELVRREQESADTVSLYLKCIRGRPLAPFQPGQLLGVVFGGRSANQQRRAYALSGNPQDLSAYRITVRRMASPDPDQPDGQVSSHLFSMKVGEHVLCTAPHWATPKSRLDLSGLVPVLMSQGLGIAPMLSMLYELEAQKIPAACLFHESGSHDPQGLLDEVDDLANRNPGYRVFHFWPDTLSAECIRTAVPLERACFHIAGPETFIERMSGELKSAGIALPPRVVQSFG